MGRIVCAGLVALAVALVGAGTAAAAPAWLPGESTFGETEGSFSTATMAPDGTVVAAQARPVLATASVLEARVRRPGEVFGPSQVIDPEAAGSPAPAAVAASDGTLAVVYIRSDGTWASIRPPGGSFGPPRLLAANGIPEAHRLAFDDAGRLWFVHEQGQTLAAAVLPPNGLATDLTVDVASGTDRPSEAAIAITPSGQVRVAYLLTTPPDFFAPSCFEHTEVREADGGSAGFGAAATLGSAQATGTNPIYPAGACVPVAGDRIEHPRLATTTGDGATTVVYGVSHNGGLESSVLARHRDPGGVWPPAASPAEVLSASGRLGEPSVVAAGETPFAAISSSAVVAVSSRNGNGTWTAPQTVSGANGGFLPRLAGSPAGTAIVAWREAMSPFRIEAAVRSPAGEIVPTATVSAVQDNLASITSASLDAEGNGMVSWVGHVGSEPGSVRRAMIAGYDGAGPRFTSLAVPASGVAGEALGFSAAAVDVWSPVGPPSWQFGGGGGASGSAVTHSFGPGDYTVTAAVTDAVGNATSASRPLRIAAAPTASPAKAIEKVRDTTPPKLTKVAPKPKKVRRGKGAKLAFVLSEAATVKVSIARSAKGTKRGGKCVKPRPKVHRRGKPCRRFVPLRSLTGSFGAGAGSLALPKSLRVGGYRLTAIATDTAGNASSPPTTATLRVVKPKKKPRQKPKRPHR